MLSIVGIQVLIYYFSIVFLKKSCLAGKKLVFCQCLAVVMPPMGHRQGDSVTHLI